MHAGWYEVIARALRRGLLKHRGFDFEEALLIEVIAGNLRDAVAQREIVLHGRTAQVEIPVLQAQLIVDLFVIGNLKRRCLGFGQHADIRDNDFNLAGRHLFVDGAFVAADNLALDGEHVLGAHAEGDIKQVCIDRFVKRTLHNAGAVTQQQKQDTAVVAGAVAPAVDDDFPAVVSCTQFAAPCGALHAVNGCIHNNLPGAPALCDCPCSIS